MQHTLKNLAGFSIHAKDGELGKVDEFYFDDITWKIRYVVVETGNWLANRKVLISLSALEKPNWDMKKFVVNLTCEQVRNSPDVDTQKTVSRQHEVALHQYYQWPQYWDNGYGGTFGISQHPLLEIPITQEDHTADRDDDLHLRSTRQVTEYHIHATNGDIGHVSDFVVDDETWTIRYLVVNTGEWFPGKNVLISPTWIMRVDWADASVYIDRMLESVKNSPLLESMEEDVCEPVKTSL